MKELLLVFAKNPVPGKAKTRLTADLGPEEAMRIYVQLLEHTAKICSPLPVHKELHYADYINQDDMWPNEKFTKRLQVGADLGERMSYSFAQAFADGFSKVIIIGTDCRDLETEDLMEAFQALDKHDSVIGPANDGGYYLLGLSKPLQSVFINKEWSTESVYADSMQDFVNAGFSVHEMPEKVDIDQASDLNETFR